MIRNRVVLAVFGLAVGGIFVYAGVLKALEPLDFAQNIRNYQVVGQTLSFFVALVLPWIEIFAGLLLATGLMRRAASFLVVAMLVFFIGLTLVTIVRGIDVDCGCFGALSRKAGWALVLEDALMLYASLCILLSRRRPA